MRNNELRAKPSPMDCYNYLTLQTNIKFDEFRAEMDHKPEPPETTTKRTLLLRMEEDFPGIVVAAHNSLSGSKFNLPE